MAGIGCFTTPEGRDRYFACYDEAIALLPRPREQADIHTSYGRVRVYRYGRSDGAPIVLLPGRAGTSAMWEPNVAALAAEHPVYALDSLGEPGRSEQSLPIRDGADTARWLDEVLESLGLSGAHLVGASAGAAMAFNQAVHRPARVASVVLLDPAQVLARFSAKFLLGGTVSALPGMPAAVADRFLGWLSGGPQQDTPLTRLITTGLREYRIRLPMPAYAPDDVLRSVRIPVLALLGGRSVVHDPQRAAERARALLPRGTAEVLPEASHAISGDCAQRVNERVLGFVAAQAAA